MSVPYNFLSRKVSTAVFVVSMILTAATLNSVVVAAGQHAGMVAYATGASVQG